MSVKRSPQLGKKEHFVKYTKMSKADIVEAFRDIFQEFGGEGEEDNEKWMEDLERRIALLKSYRQTPIDNEPDSVHRIPGFGTISL